MMHTMIPVEAKITGGGYRGVPSLRIEFLLSNQGDETAILQRLYYELFVKPAGDFLGSGQAYKPAEGDNMQPAAYLAPHGDKLELRSMFALDDRTIGMIEKSRAGGDVEFRIGVYGDTRVVQSNKEGGQVTNYKRLEAKVEITMQREEWEKSVSSWTDDQSILVVKKQTMEKLKEASRKHKKEDYDQLIQELLDTQKKADAQKGAEAPTEGLDSAQPQTRADAISRSAMQPKQA